MSDIADDQYVGQDTSAISQWRHPLSHDPFTTLSSPLGHSRRPPMSPLESQHARLARRREALIFWTSAALGVVGGALRE